MLQLTSRPTVMTKRSYTGRFAITVAATNPGVRLRKPELTFADTPAQRWVVATPARRIPHY
jgi:hypothetical protein